MRQKHLFGVVATFVGIVAAAVVDVVAVKFRQPELQVADTIHASMRYMRERGSGRQGATGNNFIFEMAAASPHVTITSPCNYNCLPSSHVL